MLKMLKMNSNELTFFKQTAICLRSTILGIFGIYFSGILGISNFRHFRHFRQSGLAYVAILVLLAIMSTLAMAFLFKTGTLRAVTVNRLVGIQAEYLAEAAANHALWRLLNDPGFPASETVYYMHTLGNGRYGYKVRKPTPTTFATVAAVGTVGSAVVKQSYVPYIKAENILTVYDRNDPAPKYRQFLGASWGPQTDTIDDGNANAQWMVLRGCPTPNSTEFILGTLDTDQHINFAVWNGSAWGNLTELTTTAGASAYHAFDIAYENPSGNALVLGRHDNSTNVKYNIWNGISWAFAAAQNASFTNDSGAMTYLTMASKPNGNEILIATVTDQNTLKVIQWNGSAFNDKGVIDITLQGNGYGIVDIVYEQQSGHALIIWSRNSSNRFYYAVWDGTSLGSATLGLDFGSPFNVVRAAADPAGDYIFMAAVDSLNDLNVAIWDGSAWVDSRELDTSTKDNAGQILDVAWEQAGQNVLVAWSSSSASTKVSYFTWRKGTALADHSVRLGPDLDAQAGLVRLLPVSGTHKIILLAKTWPRHLRYSLWTGSGLRGNPGIQLDNNLSTGDLNFDAAESGITYTGGSG